MSRYHLISINLRRVPGDRAYRIRESFEAQSLDLACKRHVAFMRERGSPNCSVLRDGNTGHRYTLQRSEQIAGAKA